jgi:cell division inhibitor SepF
MQMIEPQPAPDGFERKSFWTKVKDTLLGAEDPDDEEIEAAPGTASPASNAGNRKQTSLRIQSARTFNVAIRTNAQVFEDAKLAADGFKNGEQQIVNLERATPQMAERIIDFLNGVCYALDGTVERVGEKVYLFAPANVAVEVDEGATGTSASAPARRAGFGDKRDN